MRTRTAALALLDGDLDAAEALVDEAHALGEQVGDSDAGNVRMSQRLELVRARGDAAQLRAMADEAVRWWVGAPAHAHAVAAGFLARAGDLDGARRELDIVAALPEAAQDRSYLWSVYVGELVAAAIALHDHPLCTELLERLLPYAHTCAVNGALVSFAGAHAHRVGLLQAELGRADEARTWLDEARRVHADARRPRLAGRDRSRAAPAGRIGAARGRTPGSTAVDRPTLRRDGELWLVSYQGRVARLRDAKGLHDLAVLIGRPGRRRARPRARR